MTMWSEPSALDVVHAENKALEIEVRALRKRLDGLEIAHADDLVLVNASREHFERENERLKEELNAVRGLLFVTDMFEQCSEKQEQWSGPAQAVFTAVRQWRKSKQSVADEKLKKRVEDLEAGQRNDDRDYQRLTSALRRLLDERLLVCTSECEGGTHIDSCGIGITTRALLPKEEG